MATNSSIDHYDGDLDQTFIDDIKKFMAPVLESFFPSFQTASRFLCRKRNNFEEDWAVKFPLASNRINEKNAAGDPDEIPYLYVDSGRDQHIYDGFTTVSSD